MTRFLPIALCLSLAACASDTERLRAACTVRALDRNRRLEVEAKRVQDYVDACTAAGPWGYGWRYRGWR